MLVAGGGVQLGALEETPAREQEEHTVRNASDHT
jgi:hypothetical protein